MVALTQAQLQDLLRRAQELHRAGNLESAGAHYAQLAQAIPGNAELRHLLGVIAYQRGDGAAAIGHYHQALELRPVFPQARNNLGLALRSLGDHEAAAAAFEAALLDDPAYGECAYNLAALRETQGNAAAAETAYRAALAVRPEWPQLLGNYGNFLRAQRRLAEAETLLARAAAAAPDDATFLGNLALLRLDQSRPDAARPLAERAARLAPDTAAWWGAAGTAARLMLDAEGAAPHLARATQLAPGDAGLWLELGLVLQETGDDAGAQAALGKAVSIAPHDARARWALALSLPAIVASEAEGRAALERFDARIAELEPMVEMQDARAGLEGAATTIPFALHYLGGEQLERQRRYASLVARAARRALPHLARPIARASAAGRRIRVGFVSSYFRQHVVARFFVPLLTALEAGEFERIAWFTGEAPDARTRELAAAMDRFEHCTSDMPSLAASIRAAALDMLVFPDVGLDPRQQVLASLRLAPVQAALYGHPVTTGVDSVDCFLGAELMEDAGSAARYTERLVRLPGIGARPWPPAPPGSGRWMDALREPGRPLLACAQNLMKIPPAFDTTLAALLAGSRARLVLFDRGAGLTQRYRERLLPVLAAAGVEAAAIHFEPVRPYADYLGGLAAADLVLDTPGFSGGGTSLDALGIGAAVLCFDGEAARGRQTSAMLRMIGLEDLVARDGAEYSRLACELLRDPDRLARLRAATLERAPLLFESTAPAEAFARFLREAASPA